MSGLEVAALVAAIVSAFHGGTELFSVWRKHRRNKRAQKQEKSDDDVDKSMVRGKIEVRNRYDEDFRAMGPAFARGDGQARLDLYHHLTTIQSSIINLLSKASNGGSAVAIDLGSLFTTSESSRMGTLDALMQQYQRMAQSAPIRQALQNRPTLNAGARPEPPELCKGRLVRKTGRDGHVGFFCNSSVCKFSAGLVDCGRKSLLRIDCNPPAFIKLEDLYSHPVAHASEQQWICPICSALLDLTLSAPDENGDPATRHLASHPFDEIRRRLHLTTEGHRDGHGRMVVDTNSVYFCEDPRCRFEVKAFAVSAQSDKNPPNWDGRLELFRHKELDYDWRVVAHYVLNQHVLQESERSPVTFRCRICKELVAGRHDDETAVQLFLGHLRLHSPAEFTSMWNEHVREHCLCKVPMDPNLRTDIRAIRRLQGSQDHLPVHPAQFQSRPSSSNPQNYLPARPAQSRFRPSVSTNR